MKNMYYVALATLVAAFSCAKEANLEKEQAPVAEGHVVTLGVTMPGKDTKIDHSLVTGAIPGAIHREWSADDKILVVNRSNTSQKETFVLYEGAGTQSGKFKKDDSTLPLDGAYKIYHTSDATPGWNFNFGTQKGTLAALPEYLVNENTSITSDIALTSRLTYFHFVFSGTSANPGEARTFENAYLVSKNAEVKLYSSVSGGGGTWNEGVIKVHPDTPFAFAADGTCAIDIYVAARITGTTKDVAGAFELVFMNGDYYPGIESYSYTWTPGANYEAGQAYATDPSALLTYNNGLVGNADKASPWWDGTNNRFASVSAFYPIPTGKKLSIDFETNSTKAEMWNTWGLVASNALYGLEDFILRPSGQVWGNAEANESFFSTTSTLSDDDFKAFFDGATIHMEVERISSDYLYVTALNSKGINSFTVTYYQPVTNAAGVFFALDGANMHMKQVVSGDARTVKSVEVTSNAKVTGSTDYIILSPESVNVSILLNDNTVLRVRKSEYELTFTGSKVLYQVPNPISKIENAFTVTYKENNYTGDVELSKSSYSLPEHLGANDNSTGWWLAFTPDPASSMGYNVPAGTSLTIGTTVTSSAEVENYDAPGVIVRKADGTEYGVMRIDRYGWQYGLNTNNDLATLGWTLNANGTIKATYTGAKIYMTVSNSHLGKASVRYHVVYADHTLYDSYFDNVSVDMNDVNMAITLENCYLTFM